MNVKHLSVPPVLSKEMASLQLISWDSYIFVPVLSSWLKNTKSWQKNCAYLSHFNEIVFFKIRFFPIKNISLGFSYSSEALVRDSCLCKADDNLMYM